MIYIVSPRVRAFHPLSSTVTLTVPVCLDVPADLSQQYALARCFLAMQDDVQWACPGCSAKVEVAEMSAPQQKPKRERKEGKKRQRASSSAAGTGASSPRAGAGTVTDSAFTIPKRKKEGKRTKASMEEGGLKSPRIKREEKEEKFPGDDVAVAVASSGGDNSANRMVIAHHKANISPRVGLGLADATDNMSAMRYHQDMSGGCRINDRNSSKSIMSLAVAAASVAASEAAVAAASAAAAAPAPAPPKALGLKKLIHQRVQHDEANSNSAFSPKKLLKHRLLAAQQAPAPQPAASSVPTASSASMRGGTGGSMDETRSSGYPGQGEQRRAPPASDGQCFDNGNMGGRSGLSGGHAMDPSRSDVMDGGGRGGGGYDERDRVAAEGVLKCRTVGEGGDHNKLRAMGVMNDDANGRGYNNLGGEDGGGGDGGGGGGGSSGATERSYHGEVDRGRASASGDHRREAKFGGGGYDAGPNANGMHAGGVWRGGSADRHGEGAKDAVAGEKWSEVGRRRAEVGGMGGAEGIDTQRQQGYNSAPYGQELKVGQQVRGWNNRLTRGGRLSQFCVAQY